VSAAACAASLLLVALVVRGILPATALPSLPAHALAAALVAVSAAAAWARRREADPAPLRRDPAVFVLLGALGVLLGILLSHRMRIVSDGVDHYVYLRSLWIDHDLDLANDYAALSPRGAADSPTPLGRAGNIHPVGPALVWSPFFALADVLSRLTGRAPDGENELYLNAVSIASLLYGWLGLVLVYLAAREKAGRLPALLACLGIGFGTFLYWYLAFAPTMAHAAAFGAASLVLWLWLGPLGSGVRGASLLGAACGLTALLRWADGLVVLLPIVSAVPRLARRTDWPALLREGIAFSLAACVVFSPQMVVWKLLYGSFLTIPLGLGYVTNEPATSGVLFSPRHGLFSWSPLLYLGLAGLVVWLRREPWRAAAAVVFGLALTWINARVYDWWGGASFGARRFDALLPVLGVGIALALAGLARLARRHPATVPAALVSAFVLWNVLVARDYRSAGWDPSEPVTFEAMGHGVVSRIDRSLGSPFSLPGSLFEWLRSGRAPADYESLFMERPHARWSVRMGVDERIFLEDGWSEAILVEGTRCRRILGDSAGIVVPLHRPAAYRLGARMSAPSEVRVRLLVNQRPSGLWTVGAGWSDYEQEVAPEALRAGRNFIRLRLVQVGEAERPVVAGLWMEPRR
jgi:hypothetical protein